jgi:SAM-dependent methyltransferase
MMSEHDPHLACNPAAVADDAPSGLTARQLSELEFHRSHAAARAEVIDLPVSTDIITSAERRPWNAYWSLYGRIMAAGPAGKRVLIPGCGFGDDAIRLAMLGAEVSTFDLSPESVEIARERARRAGQTDIDFRVMPAESMADYPADHFDLVVFVDILHHVDIAATMAEVVRVMQPAGTIIGDELYTHSLLQRIRTSAPVERIAYPLLQRFIYDGETPYITPDEHKIDEAEFALVRAALRDARIDFFGLAEGRLFPSRPRWSWASRIDRALMDMAPTPLAARLGSRVLFSGTVAK